MFKKLKNNWYFIVLLLSLLIVIYFIMNILGGKILSLDHFFHAILVENLRSDLLTPIMKLITIFGSSYVLICITLLSIIIFKNKKYGFFISINLICSFSLSQILKFIVQRERPIGYNLIIEKGFSFPSGHSMVSTAFYGFLIYLLFCYYKNKKIKVSLITFLIILILFIGISRVYLGVHYMSDVVAGFLLSISYLILYIKLVGQYIEKGESYEK